MLVKCDKCGKSYKLDPNKVGKKVQCKCGHKFVVKDQDAESEPPPVPTTTKPETDKPTPVSMPPAVQSIVSGPVIKTEPTETNGTEERVNSVFVESKPTSVADARKKKSANGVLILSVCGGIIVVLAIVLIIVMNQNSGDKNNTARNSSAKKSNTAKSSSDKKNDNSKKTTSKSQKGNQSESDVTAKKQEPREKNASSIATENKNPLKEKKQQGPNKNQTSTTMFQPDLTTVVELPDWELPMDNDLAQKVDSFLTSTGPDREAIAESLIRTGKPAAGLLAAKIRAVENDRKNPYAVSPLSQVLGKIGPDAIPELMKLANDSTLKDETRSNAIRAISEMGPIAQSTIPDLIKIYKNQDAPRLRGLKLSVIGAFKNMGVATDEGIAILKTILENKTGEFRTPYLTVALQAAKAIGPEASQLVPSIRPYLLAQSNESRDAADALGAIGAGAGSSAEEFIQLIERDDKVVTYRRYHALRDIGASAKIAVPAMINALRSSTHDPTRGNIADALGRMGPAAVDALPILQAYLEEAEAEEPDQAERVIFKLAIARIQGDQSTAVPYLRQAMYDNKHNARAEAVKQIGTLGKDAIPLVPDLANMILNLETKHGVVRLAIHSLGHLGPHGKDGLGALITFINKEHLDPKGQKTFRMHAMDSIAWINSDHRVLAGLERIAHHDPNNKARDKARRLVFDLKAAQ